MNGKERWSKVVKKNGVKQTGPFFVPYKKNLIPLRKIQQVGLSKGLIPDPLIC